MGPNVTITTTTHNVRAGSRYMFVLPVTVEDDCWVGAGCTILPGVTLGNGCNIGAGAVVARDIPSATLAVGVPAKVIRVLTEDGQQVEKSRSRIRTVVRAGHRLGLTPTTLYRPVQGPSALASDKDNICIHTLSWRCIGLKTGFYLRGI